MQVIFKHNGGKEQPMQKRFADILQKMGRGTYLTRDLVAETTVNPKSEASDLSSLTAVELHALAREMGLTLHHKAGADKVRVAIEEARKAQQ